MELRFKRQPRKYLATLSGGAKEKILKALEELSELKGDIRELKGQKNLYRYKIEQYRIIFEWVKNTLVITVIEINTRTNIHYREITRK